jgi:hypothetical protein
MDSKYVAEERIGIVPSSIGAKITKVLKSLQEWAKASQEAIENFEAGDNSPFHISFDDTNEKYRCVCRVSSKVKDDTGRVISVGMRAGRGSLVWFSDIYATIKHYKEMQVGSWALQSALTSFDDGLTKPEAKGRVNISEKLIATERTANIAMIQAMLKAGVDPLVICPQHADLIKIVKEELAKNVR